jgi:hypothetical protein
MLHWGSVLVNGSVTTQWTQHVIWYRADCKDLTTTCDVNIVIKLSYTLLAPVINNTNWDSIVQSAQFQIYESNYTTRVLMMWDGNQGRERQSLSSSFLLPSIHIYIYIFVRLSFRICVCNNTYTSIYTLSTYHRPTHPSIHPPTHPPIYLHTGLPIHPTIHPPTYLPTHPPTHPHIYLPTNPSTHPPTYPPTYLPVRPSVYLYVCVDIFSFFLPSFLPSCVSLSLIISS